METDDCAANIIAEEDSKFLVIPSEALKRLTQKYAVLNVILHTTTGERSSLTELPCRTGFDQQLPRELRTSQPAERLPVPL